MQDKSLQVVVPTHSCINNCSFCVSKQSSYVPDLAISCSEECRGLLSNVEITNAYSKRLRYAKEEGCKSLVFTGRGEPFQNSEFISFILELNGNNKNSIFNNISLTTTGVLNKDYLIKFSGAIDTINLSIVDLFDSVNNCRIMGFPSKYSKDWVLEDVCKKIIDSGYNLRFSMLISAVIDKYDRESILNRAVDLGASSIVFKGLQGGEEEDNKFLYRYSTIRGLAGIEDTGDTFLGSKVYKYRGMAVIYVDNCMVSDDTNGHRYLILDRDIKLYRRWSDRSSLVY